MQISPIQNYSYRDNSPNFKHWERTVYKAGHKTGLENIVNRNNTYFFRNSDFWLDLVGFLEKTFKDIPKFNIYSYGCSDGSDVYSLIITLLAHRENLLKKCSPIIGKDWDSVAIKRANSNVYEITQSERKEINYCTCGKFDTFFKELEEGSNLIPEANVKINPEVAKHAMFCQENVLHDYESIRPNNSIVLLRNILPYLNENWGESFLKNDNWETQRKFLNDLYNHLGENSYIAIGEYDRYEMKKVLPKMLRKAGFMQTPVHNLYKRATKTEKIKYNTFWGRISEFFQKLF